MVFSSSPRHMERVDDSWMLLLLSLEDLSTWIDFFSKSHSAAATLLMWIRLGFSTVSPQRTVDVDMTWFLNGITSQDSRLKIYHQ